MKIAYIITRGDAVGGATIHVRDMASAMRDLGHEPLILAGGSGPAIDQFKAAGVPVRSLRYLCRQVHPVLDLMAVAELREALHDFAPNLVSAHTAKAGWIGRAAARLLGIPAIYTPHGLPVAGRFSRSSGRFFTFVERAAASWCSAIICVSESERRLALAGRIAPLQRLFVVHNGVRDVPPELRACPEREPVRICSVARLDHPKDFATLLTALSFLKDQPWTLDLVGEGPLRDAVRRLSARLGIAERLCFLGYQPDPAPVLARCQMLVLSSLSEAFPRSILEAMRTGLPVIATDVGGIREAVRHRETGLLVPSRDPASLARAIAQLTAAPKLRHELGVRARCEFEQRFRLEYTMKKTLAVYARAIAESSPQLDRVQREHPATGC